MSTAGDGDLEPLRLRTLVRQALASYRAHFLRTSAIALAAFLLPSLASTAVDEFVGRETHHVALALLLLVLGAAEFFIDEFGTTLYSGVLDQLVGEDRGRLGRRPIRDVLRTLAYPRLIGASLIVTVITGAAGLFFLIPGLAAFTLLCLTGPLVNIERLGIFAALRRSVELVWPRLWLVFRAVTVPLIAETVLDASIEELLHAQPWIEALVLNGVMAITFLAVISFVEVTLAHELVERDLARMQGSSAAGTG